MIGMVLFLFGLCVLSVVCAVVGDPCNPHWRQDVRSMLVYPVSVFGIHEAGIVEYIPYISYKEVA
jgi:hypothetical protein